MLSLLGDGDPSGTLRLVGTRHFCGQGILRPLGATATARDLPSDVESDNIDRVDNDDVGFLPAIAVGTLFVFYVVWAAMHDIAHANESECILESMLLAISIPAFAFLYRKALLLLTPKAKQGLRP